MFSIYKKLAWFFKQEKWRYIFLALCIIASTFFMTLPPKYLGEALDAIGTGQMVQSYFYELLIKMGIVAILIYTTMNIRSRLSQNGSYKLQYLLRNQLMRYLEEMDAHYYNDHETGDLMAVATQDVNNICMAASQILMSLFSSSFMILFVVYRMVSGVSVSLTLVAIAPLPIAIVLVNFMSKRIRRLFIESRDAFGDFNNTTLESVAGVQVIRAFVQEKHDIEKLKKASDLAKDKEQKAMRLDAAFGPLFRIVFSISVVLTITYGVLLVFEREITAGDLVSFNLYLNMLRMPMMSIGMVLNRLQRAQASYDRYEETMMPKVRIEKEEPIYPLDHLDSIEFKDYSFKYPDSHFVSLDHIDLSIKAGQTIGIIGKTGSGKSTLIQQLLRYYKKGSGEFLINGQPVEHYDYKKIREHIGYVPQEHVLFSKTVRENIQLGHVGKVSDDQLMEAIRLADFEKDLKYLRDGLDTLCGEDGTMLSGGQKQRLSIARAFIADPEILILDDSLSAIDGSTEATIIGNLRQFRKNKTNIIIAHRLSAIKHADLILVLDEGKIVERGNHDQLLAKKGWYYEQFTHQSLANGGDTHESY